jgi:hypothetical protein
MSQAAALLTVACRERETTPADLAERPMTVAVKKLCSLLRSATARHLLKIEGEPEIPNTVRLANA